MRIVIAIMLAWALQAETPRVPESLLKERWKALAVHHANTVRYLEIQAELAKSKAAYEKAMSDIKASCGDAGYDDTGADVVCKVAAK